MTNRDIYPVLDISEICIPIDTEELFGNDKLCALEVGFGDGDFLIEIADIRPDINFIGIEIKKKRFNKAVKKALRGKVPNVKFLHMDANIASTEVFKPDTFNEIYINFPDPWPKDKHEKNRILKVEFLSKLSKVLKRDGKLEIVSDHRSYIQETLDTFKQLSVFINNYTEPGYRNESEGRVETKFEKGFREEGRKIYYLMFTNSK
jgi:tRNA (guanine-N7-)-methyltransferase